MSDIWSDRISEILLRIKIKRLLHSRRFIPDTKTRVLTKLHIAAQNPQRRLKINDAHWRIR